MLFILRIGTWGLAVFFAASPVIISIASSPGRLGRLVDLSSYVDISRDLLFLAVAVLSLGIVDAVELLIQVIATKVMKPVLMGISIVLLLLIIPQLIMYSIWSAPNTLLAGLPREQIPTYVVGSAFCALAARVTLVMA